MSRPLRIEYAGAWYHVMNRGARRAAIFPTIGLRQQFLGLLGEIHDIWHVQCHAYCLMGNHYHLLLHTPQANLARAMQLLDGVFAQRYNRQMGTDGPLFRGRYKALLIERDPYLTRVSRYIHRNPLEAALCESAGQYRWSSYRAYTGLAPRPSWLYLRETLSRFDSVSHLRRFVEVPRDEELDELYARAQLPPVLGSDEFTAICRARLPCEPDPEVPSTRMLNSPPAMCRIIEFVAGHFHHRAADIVQPTTAHARTVRAVAMTLCRRGAGYPLREIAIAFGVARYTTVASAISRLRARLDRDEALKQDFEFLRQGLDKYA